ncbi:MAG: flagellar basal body P-ring protein FlgI [Planctomycetota bacterium]|nr:flagellar basal body P-ring protein FlgI [Planctomycetota bacterium]
MIASLLLTASLLVQQGEAQTPQTPPTQAAPAAGARPEAGAATQSGAGTIVTPIPSIQAPAQPTRTSNATFTTLPRRGNTARVGRDFNSRVFSQVRNLVGVRGMEDNDVVGIGVVSGLAGTGDSGLLATQLLANSLLARNINIDPTLLTTANIAVVRVEATIPAGRKPGQKVSVRVSSIGDAESLYGGILELTELTDITGQVVYATASGPVNTDGFTASGAAATATKNHVTVATMPDGATVQREIATSVVSEHGYIFLDSKNGQGTFGNTVRIAEAINALYPDVASVLPDGRTVRMSVLNGVPQDQIVAYLDKALAQEVETDNLARVVINERTGTIVMGGDVRLRPGYIHHGTIVVTVGETAEVSQPGPLSGGETVTLPRTTLDVVESNNPGVLLGGASTLEEVVEVLNVLGATPRDMIAILEAMLDGQLLIADLRRI